MACRGPPLISLPDTALWDSYLITDWDRSLLDISFCRNSSSHSKSPSWFSLSRAHSKRKSGGRRDNMTGHNNTPYCSPVIPKASRLRTWACNLSLSSHKTDTRGCFGHRNIKLLLNMRKYNAFSSPKALFQNVNSHCVIRISQSQTLNGQLGFTL